MPKLLVVAMSNSSHTARWLGLIADQNWQIHLLPSLDIGATHEELKKIHVHHTFYSKDVQSQNVRTRGICLSNQRAAWTARKLLRRISPNYQEKKLIALIRKLKPDVIHSMETQSAGYLVADAKRHFRGRFPYWLHTTWGSDLFYFGKLSQHELKLRDVLRGCNRLLVEGARDEAIARSLGFSGKLETITQAAGGFNLESLIQLRANVQQPSHRKVIILKGYQNWSGRAFVGMRALERCVDQLQGYEIAIQSASQEVAEAAERFEKKHKIRCRPVPYQAIHRSMLAIYGKARIFINLAISEGPPLSTLDAMAMGAFPIQSWPAILEGWMTDQKNALVVEPEDPESVEKAIRRALIDDPLVEEAARVNYELIQLRLDERKLREEVLNIYQDSFSMNRI